MMNKLPETTTALRPFALGVLTAITLLGVLPAHALGRVSDVQLIDRETGGTLPVYRHRGEYWVAGQPGARYAIAIHNKQRGRVLGVVSVDGINAISGETAGLDQTGYVLRARQSYRVTGWRKSDDQVAAFHFTTAPESYAERTGRPGQMGVIGVALFREKVEAPPPAVFSPWPRSPSFDNEMQSKAQAGSPLAESADQAPSAAADAMGQSSSALARRRATEAPAEKLGTGHGARENDHVRHTAFERRSPRPDEIVRIRYDSRENLIAMGIIPLLPVPPRPNPFPVGSDSRYAPDPN